MRFGNVIKKQIFTLPLVTKYHCNAMVTKIPKTCNTYGIISKYIFGSLRVLFENLKTVLKLFQA